MSDEKRKQIAERQKARKLFRQQRGRQEKKDYIKRYYRHPRTTQEIREWYDYVGKWKYWKQYMKKPRAARSAKLLPTWYDDIPIDKYQKSWKKVRKHQWREE
jgi:hypothetical protein